MYTIYDLIFACIMGGFGGILIGLVIMGVASASGYDKAVSDAYAIGYEKGKEGKKKRNGLCESWTNTKKGNVKVERT